MSLDEEYEILYNVAHSIYERLSEEVMPHVPTVLYYVDGYGKILEFFPNHLNIDCFSWFHPPDRSFFLMDEKIVEILDWIVTFDSVDTNPRTVSLRGTHPDSEFNTSISALDLYDLETALKKQNEIQAYYARNKDKSLDGDYYSI